MPFAVFRRHQKKLMAALAIFAMVAFTLDFSLFRGRWANAANNPVIVKLSWKTVRVSDLNDLRIERSRANRFMARLDPRNPFFFGPLSDRAMIDALILQHEADRLGIPAKAELAIKYLRKITNNVLNTSLFNKIYHESFSEEVTDEQLLADIANQIRLAELSRLPGPPQITPFDVYQAYRDQFERVSANAVPFHAEDYLAKVAEPTDGEVRAYYERYKSVLPDRTRDTPGFKVPRRVEVEYVSVDSDALARELKSKLTDAELREAYKARPDDFPLREPGLPVNLFAGDPEAKLTPRTTDPFVEIKPAVAARLADERAQAEIERMFGQVKDEATTPFQEEYDQIQTENKDAKAEDRPEKPLPRPGDRFQKVAQRLSLKYGKSPLMDREEAQHQPISDSTQGTGPSADSRTFAEVFFDTKTPLYDAIELAGSGHRYLAWKVDDVPARVPEAKEVQSQVVRAWKLEKARALAEKDAEAFAEQVRKADGDVKKVAGSRTVLTTPPVAKLQPAPLLSTFQFGKPIPSDIPNIPDASDALREAFFGLQQKAAAVAPNRPKTTYYVLTLNQTIPADFATLYAPYRGPQFMLQNEVLSSAYTERARSWMDYLRRASGLNPDWVPPDEAKMIAANSTD